MFMCNVVNLSSSFARFRGIFSDSIVTLVTVLHIAELIFLISSLFVVTFIALMFKKVVHKLFHINICFFLVVFFIIYYCYFFLSEYFILLFVTWAFIKMYHLLAPSSGFIWDVKLASLQEGPMFPLMYIERFYASRDLEKYEKITNIGISFSMIFACFVLVGIFEVARCIGLMEVVVMPFAIFIFNFPASIGMFFIMKQNQSYLREYYTYQLSARMQLRGNIRNLFYQYFLTWLFSTCAATIGGIIYSFAFYIQGQIGLFLSFLFDCGISFYFCLAAMVLIVFVKKLRQTVFARCMKKPKSGFRNEQNIYFQQLQDQWS